MPGSIAILEDKHKGEKVNYHDKHFKLKHCFFERRAVSMYNVAAGSDYNCSKKTRA